MSRICADLDEQVADFADRSLAETTFPYVSLDATYCKARVGGARNGKGSRVVSQAIVVATGVTADGASRGPRGSPLVTPRMGRSGPRSCARSCAR